MFWAMVLGRGGEAAGGKARFLYMVPICYKGHVPPRFAPHAHLAHGRPVVPIGKTTRHALAASLVHLVQERIEATAFPVADALDCAGGAA